MINADRLIRTLTAGTVIALGAAAAVVSYSHALDVATENGQHGWTATLTPLTIDGLVLVAGLVLLDAARRGQKAKTMPLAYVTLGLGIAATLAVNVLYGIEHGPIGAVVAGWPAVALVLSTELLMGMIRRGQRRASSEADNADEAALPDGDGKTDVPAVVADEAPDNEPVPAAVVARAEGDNVKETPLVVADNENDGKVPVPRRNRPTPPARRVRVAVTPEHVEQAKELVGERPGITGAQLGRQLGLSERQGQRILADLRAALVEVAS
ncbi:DUF2637 domain-containing protein [Actinocorallia aurantiaca]|uniref:DUF2637 domain-containing protein n=1 Tax=Actinocorallia aurantiaca TaxID=46204 RepID=A0ABP6H2V2_9ACTN